MASKKRLIDAEELWKKFESEPWYDNADRDEIALPMVYDAPTVDAVEVVHGRWEEIGAADYRCSRCGFRFSSADPIAMFQYCRCGAKMGGDWNG